MNVFNIIGPVMIGPSSSHTAGAARAGIIARNLLGEKPIKAIVRLYGSFSLTYMGHGVDRAIIGGILGFEQDDIRIKESFEYAEREGLEFQFICSEEEVEHPNTTQIQLKGEKSSELSVTISSIGGGRVNVTNINGADLMFNAEYHTTVIFNQDRPGIVAQVTSILAKHNINIAFMRLFRKYEGKDAIMVIETDNKVHEGILDEMRHIKSVFKVITISPLKL